MNNKINKPYKLNWHLYLSLLFMSIMLMILGIYLQEAKGKILADIILNIGLGCFASTIVALIIEFGNIKEKNEKHNDIYMLAYSDLQFSIMKYIEGWSEFCSVAGGEKDYCNKEFKWKEWYSITKEIFADCSENKKTELLAFLKNILSNNIKYINEHINYIMSQRNILEIHDLYNDDLNFIIKDFKFEFYCAEKEVEKNKEVEDFFKTFDAINEDITRYIEHWQDIKIYNNIKFKPYEFFESLKLELIKNISGFLHN